MKYIPVIFPILLLTVQVAHAQLYVQSLATLSTNGNAVITLQNTDLVCNGVINQVAGSGTFVFAGTGNNTISGASITTLDKLQIAKTGTGKLLLSQNVTIGSGIDFISGLIDLNGFKILLQPAAKLNTESETSHIMGSTGSIQIGNIDATDLPVYYNAGNLGAAIIANQNLGTLQVSRNHASAVNPANTLFTGIQRSYTITPTNDAGLNATLRFYYLDAELNGKNENTLGLWRSDDGIHWTLAGTDSRNTTDNYVEKAGITSFSTWTLTDATDALPVILMAFKAVCENSYALLQWQTATEENAAAFIIEKTNDGNTWSGIGRIAAQNSLAGAVYTFQDAAPQPTAFYRLKMVDADGKFTYSPVFSGGCNDLPLPFAVYPNPARTITTARLSARQSGTATLQLYSSSGQLLSAYGWHISAGTNSLPITVSNLPAGIYLVRILLNGEVLQSKLLKE